VPLLEAGKPVEYLYWVGCSASYDTRNQKIARSMVKILRQAGVSFGVMAEERCHGEVGRRLGEEYLYQTAAEENVGNLRRYEFGKVLTHCPHCFNTLANEYPQFDGGRFEVCTTRC
jgi:Fe-S oxidoreductase